LAHFLPGAISARGSLLRDSVNLPIPAAARKRHGPDFANGIKGSGPAPLQIKIL
jgi:hypothetical protein